MAFLHGKNTRILVDEWDLSSYFSAMGKSGNIDAAETPQFRKGNRTYSVGLAGGRMTLGGLFDGDVNAVDEELAALLGAATDPVVTGVRQGADAVGDRAMLIQGPEVAYEVSAPNDGVVAVSGEIIATDGPDSGVIHHQLKSETGTQNSASVDNAASSANGGVAHLHVTAYATFTDVQVKIQHSTDDAVWADLVTFTLTTAVGKERVVVAKGTTVNRYVRAMISAVNGAGSLTYVAAFARR